MLEKETSIMYISLSMESEKIVTQRKRWGVLEIEGKVKRAEADHMELKYKGRKEGRKEAKNCV